MKKRNIIAILLTLILTIITLSSTASVFAAEPSERMINTASARTTSFGVGDWYWGGVTFTGHNGGAYKTINGTKVKIKVAFKPVDSKETSANLHLDFVEYGGRYVYSKDYSVLGVTPDKDGYFYYESGWVSVKKGVDYRFLYDANSDCACYDPRKVTVHIWIEVK